jgi:hypothetical protein
MENYKEKCEQYLERAKKEIKECGDNQGRINMIKRIFPELRESEDEKIRKDIISFIERNKRPIAPVPSDDTLDRWIAWLEKQGDKSLSTEETELNSLAFQTELGYTCIPPKKEGELTEFEKELARFAWRGININDLTKEAKEILHKDSKPLLDLAKKKILKDLPKWKKAEKDEELDCHVAIQQDGGVVLSDFVQKDEYYITLNVLKKLPKEEQL